MATYTKYNAFVENLMNKAVDLFGTEDTVKAIITSDASQTLDAVLTDVTQITGTGYTAGGDDIQNDATRTTDTVTMTAVDVVWTASAGDWVAGQYVSIYDDTATNDCLIAFWDYGSTFTLGNGETFTLDFGASVFTIA